ALHRIARRGYRGRGGLISWRSVQEDAQRLAAEFDIRPRRVDARVEQLSGGNQQKVVMARAMALAPRVLVLGHPTRGLDIGARRFIYDQIGRARGRAGGLSETTVATSEDLLTVTTGEDVLGVPPEPVRGSVALRTLQLLLPAVGAFGVICVAVLVLGADPLLVLGKMISGSLGSQYDVSEVLMVMAPLILCGLAAAVPFSARLWNIGGDGQLYVGAVAAVVVGLNVGKDVPGELLAALCVLAGIAAGACWAIVAGLVKVLV